MKHSRILIPLAFALMLPNFSQGQERCAALFTDAKVAELAVDLYEANERGDLASKPVEEILNEVASEIAGSKIEVIDSKDHESISLLKKIRAIPGKIKNNVGQVQELLRAYKQLRSDIKAAMTTAELDEQLDSFRGFHHDMEDAHFDRRTWKPLSMEKITKDQVVGIDPEAYAQVAGFAMEVEAPTMPYSYSTGESFSNLFPKIGRFMGKDKNQQLYAEKTGKRTCESAWCAEEERHAGFLAQVVFRLTGKMPSLNNSNVADMNARDEKSAMHHLGERQTYEWNAASSYFFLMSHSTGHLREAMSNILKDEVKHLTIMSSAYTYIYGYRPWKRFAGILKNTYDIMKKHDGERTDAAALQGNKMLLVKMLLTHVIVEVEMRKYLATLPHHVLAHYFDAVSQLPKLGETGLSPAEKAEIEKIRDSYVERRTNLEWWDPKQAQFTKNMLSFAQSNKDAIDRIVQEKFSGFVGAESPQSPAEQILKSQMGGFINTKSYRSYFPSYLTDSVIEAYLPKVLYGKMREYQISNNKYEQAKKDLKANAAKNETLRISQKPETPPVSATVQPGPVSAKVLSLKSASEGFLVVRVQKPDGFKLEVGSSVSLGLGDAAGTDSRILSLASSPDKDYLEFAVKVSDSTFKKKFADLKPSDVVSLTKYEHKLAFDTAAPMVMIATGIGITPFRSMLQFAQDAQLKTPMWLFYGNRTEIPFESEIAGHSKNISNIEVRHTLSQPKSDWTGATGRVDKKMLQASLPSIPANAKYYVVGSPDMIRDTRETLLQLGVADSQIIIEAFFSNAIGKSGPAKKGDAENKLDEKEMICFCKRVTTGQILSLVKAGQSVDSAIACTGAGGGCGGCAGKVAAIKECIK